MKVGVASILDAQAASTKFGVGVTGGEKRRRWSPQTQMHCDRHADFLCKFNLNISDGAEQICLFGWLAGWLSV